MTNRAKYREAFMRVFNVEASALGENFTFADVEQWDSLAHITLISELEADFDIMLDTEDILNYGSYKNGMTLLRKYGVHFEPCESPEDSYG